MEHKTIQFHWPFILAAAGALIVYLLLLFFTPDQFTVNYAIVGTILLLILVPLPFFLGEAYLIALFYFLLIFFVACTYQYLKEKHNKRHAAEVIILIAVFYLAVSLVMLYLLLSKGEVGIAFITKTII